LIADLCRSEFVRAGTAIRRAAHMPALSAPLQAAATKIRAALAAKPFDPPSRKDLAPDPMSQQALRFLIESGELVDINAEIVMTTEGLKRATELVREFIRTRGPSTTSDLRQMLSSSRRVAMPLLERLDRDAITLRQGDKRVLRR
jgi:selenocysteine-specific elongation factor